MFSTSEPIPVGQLRFASIYFELVSPSGEKDRRRRRRRPPPYRRRRERRERRLERRDRMDDDEEGREGKEERKEEGNCVLQRRFRPLPLTPPPTEARAAAAAAETTSAAAAAASSATEVAFSVLRSAQFSHKSPLLTQSELSSVLQSVEEDYTRKADFRKAYPGGSATTAAEAEGDLNSQVVISGPLPPPLQPPPSAEEERERERSRDNNPDHSDRPDNRVLHTHNQGSTDGVQ